MDATPYRDALVRSLKRRLRDQSTAEDIAQEAFVRLLATPRNVEHPQAYLFRIASNVAYEVGVRERRDVVIFNSRLTADVVDFTDVGDAIDRERLLEGLLSVLPPLYASMLVMKKHGGLSMEEIARDLGVSVHTVKKYLTRAVAHCRAVSRSE